MSTFIHVLYLDTPKIFCTSNIAKLKYSSESDLTILVMMYQNSTLSMFPERWKDPQNIRVKFLLVMVFYTGSQIKLKFNWSLLSVLSPGGWPADTVKEWGLHNSGWSWQRSGGRGYLWSVFGSGCSAVSIWLFHTVGHTCRGDGRQVTLSQAWISVQFASAAQYSTPLNTFHLG